MLRHPVRLFVITALVVGSLPLVVTLANPIDDPNFNRVWSRTDLPVADGQVDRTWMWGPRGHTEPFTEPYDEAPGGQRVVQYTDKSRMEDNSFRAEPPWDVTNGLIAMELITGALQLGDDRFEQREPADIPVAGDPHPDTPTYATFGQLLDEPALPTGAEITHTVNKAGTISEDGLLAAYGQRAGPFVPETGHSVANVFWEFMNARGVVYEDGEYRTASLFENEFFAVGYPVTEAYWLHVPVAGEWLDVLAQCFERRCLTFTPVNSPGWQVEAANIGTHYYQWRHLEPTPPEPDPTPTPDISPDPTPTPPAGDVPDPTPTPDISLIPTPTPPAIDVPDPTPTPDISPDPTPTPDISPDPTATPVPTQPDPVDEDAACLVDDEAEILNLVNQHRQQNGVQPLEVSEALNIAAYKHSVDMGERDYYDHVSPDGETPRDRKEAEGYDYPTPTGENLHVFYPDPQKIFEDWRDSPGHNQNMLNPDYNVIGIGRAVVPGSEYEYYWTTKFGGHVDDPPSC